MSTCEGAMQSGMDWDWKVYKTIGNENISQSHEH